MVHSCLDCFQIQMSGLVATIENHVQELIYFARDFLANCICRFFSAV